MSGTRKPRARFWVESGLAVATALLFAVTAVTPDWVEVVFGFDPDQNSGLLEWATVLLAATALACIVLARIEWRRPARAGA
jgi:hypothetical protein